MTGWPALREELSLHPGPAAGNGWPSWVLRDPVRNSFFRLDWPGFEILARWALGDPGRIAAAVSAETTLTVAADDVVELMEVLARGHLLRPAGAEGTARLVAAAGAARQSIFAWLLHHYLFFRIPVVRPDRFLAATAPWVGWLGGRAFLLATLAALVVGLVGLARQWDRFTATLPDTISLGGAATYGLALAGAKLAHEMAHAYTARRLGCRVPTMGVAFLVLWPVLYTDVNEAWLLPRRRHRLAVAAAGVAAELALAAWATLAWVLLDDGPARQAAFVLATVTWISSVVVNLSPFMRFDGYFLMMDAFDLPNLHPRSFALARWRLREALFGLGEAPPERLDRGRERALVGFAVLVWLYRLVLFLGIAVLVYHFFVKALGIVLFAVEIGWFVLRPVMMEMAEWRARGAALWRGRRARVSLGLAAFGVVAALVPWPAGVTAPAMLAADRHMALYPPVPAQLDMVLVRAGQDVAAGEELFRLSAPDVSHRRAQAERRIAVLHQELGASGFDAALQSRTQSLREELQAAIAERLTAERELARLVVVAPLAGRVTDLAVDLRPGQWLSPRDKLASVLGGDHAAVTAYVSEDAVDRLHEGAAARFVATAPGRAAVAATIVAVERVALRHLDAAALASVAGGPIAVRSADHALVPEQALYRVRLSTTVPPPDSELVGTVRLSADGASAIATLWTKAVRLLVREAGM